jgi:hypothetical protein
VDAPNGFALSPVIDDECDGPLSVAVLLHVVYADDQSALLCVKKLLRIEITSSAGSRWPVALSSSVEPDETKPSGGGDAP